MFASLTDIQSWLRSDVVPVDDANSAKANLDAMRTIKGQLSGAFSVLTISSWDSPANTPELIRSIAGRLAAAFMYRALQSSEQAANVDPYAQELYNEAIAMLQEIVQGGLIVTDSSDNPVDTTGTNLLSFWPDSTIDPLFTYDKTFS